jgi:hypothetical protein
VTSSTTKQQWIEPSIRRYGTFESVTATCDKRLGGADGFTFMGQAIICVSTASGS